MVNEREFIQRFGENLRKVRLSRNFSQEILAIDADIPVNQVGRIERAEIRTSLGTVYKLAKALHVNPKDLFDF